MTFQRLMDSLLGGLSSAFVYLDDILIASTSVVVHRRHLAAVSSILQQNGLSSTQTSVFLAQATSSSLATASALLASASFFQGLGHCCFSATSHCQAAAGLLGCLQILQVIHSCSSPHHLAAESERHPASGVVFQDVSCFRGSQAGFPT
jgi:3-oxoacyl-(acyl-carrier-protein) synthase